MPIIILRFYKSLLKVGYQDLLSKIPETTDIMSYWTINYEVMIHSYSNTYLVKTKLILSCFECVQPN